MPTGSPQHLLDPDPERIWNPPFPTLILSLLFWSSLVLSYRSQLVSHLSLLAALSLNPLLTPQSYNLLMEPTPLSANHFDVLSQKLNKLKRLQEPHKTQCQGQQLSQLPSSAFLPAHPLPARPAFLVPGLFGTLLSFS